MTVDISREPAPSELAHIPNPRDPEPEPVPGATPHLDWFRADVQEIILRSYDRSLQQLADRRRAELAAQAV